MRAKCVPLSTIRPSSRMSTRSALRTVEKRWLISTTARRARATFRHPPIEISSPSSNHFPSIVS
ncbi:MAG TPA: hypothetical protein PLB30_05795 [Thermoleophilia bacterium]|nr:hypothetical protein [Thermoleophilia bacterium]HQG54457.1 hypothetical protein [Thermoleophilia bacterium]HQJ98044.1 hypothetical protein [Thermoleophilia bacterium]